MPRVIFQVDDHTRALMVEAAHRELVSLSEWLRRAAEVRLNGGLAAGEEKRSGDGVTGEMVEVARVASTLGRPPAASPAKKCSREARHHINHSGKPCPECGYPTA